MSQIYIGTAGWQLPPQVREMFVGSGSNLERYSRLLNAVEINSSFYRDHKPETYRKWAESVPSDFRFAVKLNKYFTRERQLTETGDKLQETLDGIVCLEEKLGALLIQIPGRLNFHHKVARRFFADLRKRFEGEVVFEPRNLTWASHAAADLLADYNISKVMADPEPCMFSKKLRAQTENTPYLRLHGAPQIYKSRYPSEVIARVALKLATVKASGSSSWCIFDNTTYGYAIENALELTYLLGAKADFALNSSESNTRSY